MHTAISRVNTERIIKECITKKGDRGEKNKIKNSLLILKRQVSNVKEQRNNETEKTNSKNA